MGNFKKLCILNIGTGEHKTCFNYKENNTGDILRSYKISLGTFIGDAEHYWIMKIFEHLLTCISCL